MKFAQIVIMLISGGSVGEKRPEGIHLVRIKCFQKMAFDLSVKCVAHF